MSISIEIIDRVLIKLNDIAVTYKQREFGLPLHDKNQWALMREAVREVLERPATQYCPQCEAKAKQVEHLEARLKANNNLNAELCTKVVELQDTINKQRYIERARGVLRIAELEAQLRAYQSWGAAAHVLVAEMVDMLTPEQVGHINGLRSWQETEPASPQYVAMWGSKEVHHE